MNTKVIAACIAATAVAATLLFAQGGSASLPVSAEQQKAMTPDEVLSELKAGNKRFVTGEPEAPNVAGRIEAGAKGQYPMAVVLSCLDSRVPVEQVFDQGIGDLFVGRVAGNVENVDQLGSMEFATKLAGSKLIVVLGHSSCGAVKGACDGAEMGNLTELLAKIKPAIDAVEGHDGNRNSSNAEFVAEVVEQNVRQTVADIRSNSEVLADLEKEGAIRIVGGLYDLASGKVTFLED